MSLQPALGVWGESFDELEAVSRAAEDAGFAALWTSELHRTATIPLAAMARATSTVGLGTGIMWAFTRSPMVTALSALDLDEASGGRLMLGLGTGVKRLNTDWHNRPFDRPVRRLRETIAVIRAVVAGAHAGIPIEVEGQLEHLRLRGYERPFPPPRTTIPIYLAAVGPQLTQLAGELADGWIAHELGSPDYLVERILPQLERGWKAVGRSRGDFTVVVSACCVPHRNAGEARRQAAGLIAFYATVRTYDDFFDFHGFLPHAKEVQQRFRVGDRHRLADAIPDEMVDALTIAGTPDDVRSRLRAYEGLADMVKLSPPTHFVAPEVTRESQHQIIELFAS